MLCSGSHGADHPAGSEQPRAPGQSPVPQAAREAQAEGSAELGMSGESVPGPEALEIN